MKRIVFYRMAVVILTALTGMVMASCLSNEDYDGTDRVAKNTSGNYVDFSVGVNNSGSTRGSVTTLASLQVDNNSFMAWGYYSADATGSGITPGSLYLGTSNTEGAIIKYTTPSWNYINEADRKLWPVETAKLNFQAVTPYDYGTIINSPSDNIAAVGMTITVPTTVTDQKDLLFGHAEELTNTSNSGLVPIVFEHALSQIVFKGKVDKEGLTAVVKSVKICNVKSTADVGYLGTRYVDNNGTEEDSSDDVTTQRRLLAVSTGGSSGTNYTATAKYAIGLAGNADVTLTSTTAIDLCATNGALMMIPQSGLTPWSVATTGKTIDEADDDGETYLEVECKVRYTSNDVYILGSPSEYGKIYLPLRVNWAIGKKYTYVLNFGGSGSTPAGDPDDPDNPNPGGGGFDEDGNKIMNYISFSVQTITDWVDGTEGNFSF